MNIGDGKNNYLEFQKIFVERLNKHALQRKPKYFERIISLTLIKHWEKLLWNVLNLKIKQIKRKAINIFYSKRKKTFCVVKLDNQSKQHFDSLNPFLDSKPFWKSCKPYFSNRHLFGDSKIALNENGEIVTGNMNIAKAFNSYLEAVTDSLELFDWSLQSNISYGKVQNIIKTFSNHPKSRTYPSQAKYSLSSVFLRLLLETLQKPCPQIKQQLDRF